MSPEWSGTASAAATAVSALVAVGALGLSALALAANRRSAAAAEASARAAEALLEMAREVKWQMGVMGVGDFTLTNIGGQNAYDVRADLEATGVPLGRWAQIGQGEAVLFSTSVTPGHRESMVIVTYRLRPQRPGAGPEHWRHPLPPWPR